MNKGSIHFYFEFASSYSYLAVMRIQALAKTKNISVLWKPFLLGPLFKDQGWQDSPFNLYPAKGKYMWRDMERLCQKYDLAFKKPKTFPRNGLLAARIAHWSENQTWNPDFVKLVFQANFAQDQNIADPQLLSQILKSLGQDPKTILEKAYNPKNKESLQKRTAEAKELGIFGAPSFIVDQELFWGHDRMEEAFELAIK
ncbi:MAG: 2-hydroxychromene-2-carboxylate isomerase [Deltaproteobacteria bacterium]|nr:2-hydroxychromene-2-carboxylate isomerase [Deltaproteobacteria bacterium]